jgi:hypothetical protein
VYLKKTIVGSPNIVQFGLEEEVASHVRKFVENVPEIFGRRSKPRCDFVGVESVELRVC